MVTKSPFITEAAIEFSLAIFVLILRLISRWHLVGFRGWGIDDYLCILAALFVTVRQTLNSNIGWTPEQRATFSQEEIGQMQITAKLVIAGWFAYAGALWSLKGAVLIYYNRIMCGVAQQTIIRVTGVYCGLSFIAVVLAIFLRCRPFEKLWQIYRDPGLRYEKYPLMVIPPNRKVVVGILLCSGVFIIVAALLRCVMSLLEISQINLTAVWTVREIISDTNVFAKFVAFVAVNSPAIKPLFTPSSWKRLPKVVDASVKHQSHPEARIVPPQNNGSFDAYPPTLQPPAPSVHTLSGISHSDRSTDWDLSPQAPNIRFPEQALYDYV
ncbi:hypothetical protein IFM47457_03666 [Aspergillus lentulus]|nr:hypothetical protein IFM47457_03666 [Aspergillus lentulus]